MSIHRLMLPARALCEPLFCLLGKYISLDNVTRKSCHIQGECPPIQIAIVMAYSCESFHVAPEANREPPQPRWQDLRLSRLSGPACTLRGSRLLVCLLESGPATSLQSACPELNLMQPSAAVRGMRRYRFLPSAFSQSIAHT